MQNLDKETAENKMSRELRLRDLEEASNKLIERLLMLEGNQKQVLQSLEGHRELVKKEHQDMCEDLKAQTKGFADLNVKMLNRLTKIIVALLGIVGAEIGARFVGSPPVFEFLEIAILSSSVIGVTLFGTNWHRNLVSKILTISGGIWMFMSSAWLRYYGSYTLSPEILIPAMGMMILSFLFASFAWCTVKNPTLGPWSKVEKEVKEICGVE